jgi:hypothetical protein
MPSPSDLADPHGSRSPPLWPRVDGHPWSAGRGSPAADGDGNPSASGTSNVTPTAVTAGCPATVTRPAGVIIAFPSHCGADGNHHDLRSTAPWPPTVGSARTSRAALVYGSVAHGLAWGHGFAGTWREGPDLVACSGGHSGGHSTRPYWTEPDRTEQNAFLTWPA